VGALEEPGNGEELAAQTQIGPADVAVGQELGDDPPALRGAKEGSGVCMGRQWVCSGF
jgi:hypothetical protein